MLKKVPTIKTTYTTLELCKSLISSWKNLTEGQLPSKEAIGIVYSQHSIETGRGNYCWNNNLGNIKASDVPNQEIEYMSLNGVWEIINGVRVELPPENPGSWFRSFPDLISGCEFYLDFLKNHRYKDAWISIENGDVVGFATTLKNKGYYTAPLQDYINGMNSYFFSYTKSAVYEQAIQEMDFYAPPLNTWVNIPVEQAQVAELSVLPEKNNTTPFSQGIDDAKEVPISDIENVGGNFIQYIMNFLAILFQWLKQHK